MSDSEEESVVEELEESLDESVEENYSGDDFAQEDEEDEATVSSPAAHTSAINLDDLVVPPSLQTSGEGVRGLSGAGKREESKEVVDDEYSYSFDDDSENQSALYTHDFENDLSVMSMTVVSPEKTTRGHQSTATSKKPQSTPLVPSAVAEGQVKSQPEKTTDAPVPQHVFPSLAMQSLEAENAMDKLSKEILYLRNQQRVALKQRRIEARNKKLRADERRRKYQEDLANALHDAAELKIEKKQLEEKISVLELTLKGAEESKALIADALEKNAGVLEEQNEKIRELETRIEDKDKLLSEKEDDWLQIKAEMNSDMESLRKALVKAELHVSVMIKSNEATEERLARDRAQLPKIHQDILDERLRHLASIEESAQKREDAAKSEQETGRLLVENLRKELHSEIDRREVRLNAEIDGKRASLVKAQKQLEYDIEKYNIQKVEDASQIEKKLLCLRREENLLSEREKVLQQQHMEFNVAKQVIEPEMLATKRDREESQEQLRKADLILQQSKHREQQAKARLDELEEREAAVDRAWAQIERERENMHAKCTQAHVLTRKARRDRNLLDEEREKLQKISIELTNQFLILQKATLSNHTIKSAPRALTYGHQGFRGAVDRDHALVQSMALLDEKKAQLDNVPHYSLDHTLEHEDGLLIVCDSSAQEHPDNERHISSMHQPDSSALEVFTKSPDNEKIDNATDSIHDVEIHGNERNKLVPSGINKSWDSLEYSSISPHLPPPPPTHNRSSSDWNIRDRNSKKDVECLTGLSKENVDPVDGIESIQRHSISLTSPPLPPTPFGEWSTKVEVTTEAMKSAALRYGVSLGD